MDRKIIVGGSGGSPTFLLYSIEYQEQKKLIYSCEVEDKYNQILEFGIRKMVKKLSLNKSRAFSMQNL